MRPQPAILSCMFLALCPAVALGLGEEAFGNKPLHEANYGDWPNVMPVINHHTRVYHSWVNGNEHFYYRGSTADLNDVLQKFAAVTTESREVVLRPGPCAAKSFDGTAVAYNWQLHLIGGIARHLSTRELGGNVWPDHPVLTICVGGDIELDKLQIPPGLKVIELTDLKKRHTEALKSGDQTVRGWGAGNLAALDPHDPDSVKTISNLLDDESNWVRLNAVGALATFGHEARPAIPALRKQLEVNDKALQTRAAETIKQIEQASDAAEEAKRHREQLDAIRQFVSRRDS